MVSFIDAPQAASGVEPICAQLPIAPSTDYKYKARRADPARLPPRARRDRERSKAIRRGYEENFQGYGARQVWRPLGGEGLQVALGTVERLRCALGLKGVVRGKKRRTTVGDDSTDRPVDRVNHQFRADRPDQLWGADFTSVATGVGLVYTAFVMDVFARRIVGWRVARSMNTDGVLDALEQALWARSGAAGVVPHSDRGNQYLAIRYSERLTEAGVLPSMGSVGDSYDNALAETILGLYKTVVIPRQGPWRNLEAVEYAPLEGVDWFNHRRLLEPIGYAPPAELERTYYRQLEESAIAA